MTSVQHNLRWFIEYRFGAPDWFADRRLTGLVFDAFAATQWLREMNVFGAEYRAGAPVGSPSEVRDVVVSGAAGVYGFARGDAAATRLPETAEASFTLEILPGTLVIKAHVSGAVLAGLRARALDEPIAAVLAVDPELAGVAHLSTAVATPDADQLPYRRVRPPRAARRTLNQVAEIVEPALPDDVAPPDQTALVRAMTGAPLPAGVESRTAGRLVVQRWVTDPADPVATAEACSRHERWIVPLLTAPISNGWNAEGDQRVRLVSVATTPPADLVDLDRRIAYVRVDGEGDAAWKTAAGLLAARRLDDGGDVAAVALIAGDRAAAVRLRDPALAAGFARVVYPEPAAPTRLWDPDPPGSWLPVEGG